ncbi:MAG: FAD-dependent oxidoreductase [SAR202 cluster bacterium]|nr:FAD-dependent oxidoreductase [SAR202 cluster bacterium]
MAETTDVAIIGGGAAGCAVAFYLAQAGVKSTIIERDGLGNQASGNAAGGLNPLTGIGIPGPLGSFAWECYQLHAEMYEGLKEQSGIDYQHRTVTKIDLALEESEIVGLKASADRINGVEGFQAHWIEPDEIAKLEPRIAPGVLGGLYDHGNTAVASHEFTHALAAVAGKMGSTVRAGNVRSLESTGGRVDRVVLADGEVSCGQVVMAMGPWSRRAESWLGVYIPVDPLKGEILRLELEGAPIKYDITGAGAAIYPKLDGLNWCGTTEDWKGFDLEPSEEVAQEIRRRLARVFPELANAKVAKHTACLRPVTPDWLPVLGRAPGWENVYLATGAGKKGILLAPGIGKSVADLMTSGQTALSIQGYFPERFATQLD